MPATLSNPQYDEPPVRSVVLTVYYAPMYDFGLPLALELAKLWAGRYPAITQEPLRPRPPELPSISPFDGSTWPFPRIVQTDNTLSRSISYQFDQISLRWTFDGGKQANRYPGFDDLFIELQTVYKQFAELSNKLSESNISVQACGCEYVNNFDDIAPEAWIAGYVSSWKVSIPTNSVTSSDEKVFCRFTGALTDDTADIEKKYSLQVSRKKGGGALVRIRASASSTDQKTQTEHSNSKSVKALMARAHDLLIDTFEKASDGAMKKKWGKRGHNGE